MDLPDVGRVQRWEGNAQFRATRRPPDASALSGEAFTGRVGAVFGLPLFQATPAFTIVAAATVTVR
nr:hypothetical protein GCM10010200_082830 [Actinomadura rugatobispora]